MFVFYKYNAWISPSQHWSKEEKVPWTDNGALEFVCVEVAHKGMRAPPTPKNHHFFLAARWSMRHVIVLLPELKARVVNKIYELTGEEEEKGL